MIGGQLEDVQNPELERKIINPRPLFRVNFQSFQKSIYNFGTNINNYPSSIRCQDRNSQLLDHHATTNPGLLTEKQSEQERVTFQSLIKPLQSWWHYAVGIQAEMFYWANNHLFRCYYSLIRNRMQRAKRLSDLLQCRNLWSQSICNIGSPLYLPI